jgi:hypothetical protein
MGAEMASAGFAAEENSATPDSLAAQIAMSAEMATNIADSANAAENPELSAFERYTVEDNVGDGGIGENPELSAHLWFQAGQAAEFPPLLCTVEC